MKRSVAAALGWLVLSFCAVSYAMALLLVNLSSVSGGTPIVPPQVLAFLAFPMVGALIVTQRPRNTVGWLFCAIGLGTSITSFSGGYVTHALAVHADAQLATGLIDALGNAVWILNLGLGSLLLFLFPDGRLPSRRWRFVFWLDVAGIVAVSLSSLLYPGPLESHGRVVNPIGIPVAAPLLNAITSIGQTLFIPLALSAVVSVIVRYRREEGTQRQQIKWFAYGAALLVLTIFVTVIVVTALTPSGQDGSNSLLSNVGFSLAFIMLPIGAGIGVLRYRLYDIDLIINRTLVYGSLTAILAGVYFGTVVGIQQLVRLISGQQAEQNPLVIVLSTLLIAALFTPLRQRIQQFIDRRFYRAKYDTARTLERFAATLRQDVDLAELREHLLGVVMETMQPAHVSLWLRETEPRLTGGPR
jgi:hypothetical protein